jgi:hypothetical protein
LSGGPHITTTSRGTDKKTVPLELHLLFPAVPKGMIGRCAPEGKNLVPSVVIVSLIWFFYSFRLLLCVRIGDLAVVIHRRIFGHGIRLIFNQLLLLLLQPFFFKYVGGNLFFVSHFCALM